MEKTTYFAAHRSNGWPRPKELERYFLAPAGQRLFLEAGGGGGALRAKGADGTEHLPENKGRIDIDLEMWANPDLGVLLIYSKWGGGLTLTYSSKGDLGRLREWVRSAHGDQLPVGLFIPFREAWTAVKEFIETDGELPQSIDWIANSDLPENTFPPLG